MSERLQGDISTLSTFKGGSFVNDASGDVKITLPTGLVTEADTMTDLNKIAQAIFEADCKTLHAANPENTGRITWEQFSDDPRNEAFLPATAAVEAMREPSDQLAKVMNRHAANGMVDWRDLHKAMIDAILNEKPE